MSTPIDRCFGQGWLGKLSEPSSARKCPGCPDCAPADPVLGTFATGVFSEADIQRGLAEMRATPITRGGYKATAPTEEERAHFDRFGRRPDAECWLHQCDFSHAPAAEQARKEAGERTRAAVAERDAIIERAVRIGMEVHGRGLRGREVADLLAGRIVELEAALREVLAADNEAREHGHTLGWSRSGAALKSARRVLGSAPDHDALDELRRVARDYPLSGSGLEQAALDYARACGFVPADERDAWEARAKALEACLRECLPCVPDAYKRTRLTAKALLRQAAPGAAAAAPASASREELANAVLESAATIIERAGGCAAFEGGCVALLRALSPHEVLP